MKKYFEPEMNISTFSSENVVTASGKNPITGGNSSAGEYGNANNKLAVSYNDIAGTLEFK